MTIRPLIELREYRTSQKPPLSQRQMALILGVSRVTVARWEAGARRPDREYVPELSKLTGVEPAELMGVSS